MATARCGEMRSQVGSKGNPTALRLFRRSIVIRMDHSIQYCQNVNSVVLLVRPGDWTPSNGFQPVVDLQLHIESLV